LSFPVNTSVNDGIYKDFYVGEWVDLTYPSVDTLAASLKRVGTKALMFKKDLAKAYRQFPLDPGDIRLVGYIWKDQVFIDLALVMGCRSAAHLCQRVTNSLNHMCPGFDLINYIDDLAGVSEEGQALTDYSHLTSMLVDLGLEESVDKSIAPCTEMKFLRVHFNACAQTMSVTRSRLDEIHELLDIWLKRRSASKKLLESLIGKLQFMAK